jgi:hypothetical protein
MNDILNAWQKDWHMELAEIEYKGIVWSCEYEYDPPQKADDTDPAIPGIATIYMLYIRDKGIRIKKDLIAHIDAHTIHALEAQLEENNEGF